jgi:NTP pyrophosphatase (non-canonical NTP hydrolase)
MELRDYQLQALDSVAITEKNLAALAHRSLGLVGEAGELANVIKKIIRDKDGKATEEDIRKAAEKLGDTLYYVAVLAEYFDLDLEEVARTNLKKSQAFKRSRGK